MSSYAALGIDLQEDAIRAVLYRPAQPIKVFKADFLTSGNWPQSLWQHSELLLKLLVQIKYSWFLVFYLINNSQVFEISKTEEEFGQISK